MAIEIIKAGKGPRGKKYVHKCPDCETVFTFEVDDLCYNVDIERYFMYCPNCSCREFYVIDTLEEYYIGKDY